MDASQVEYLVFDFAKGYDPDIIPPLLNILVLALSSPSDGYKREAYIAITQRNEDTLAGFIRQAGESDSAFRPRLF